MVGMTFLHVSHATSLLSMSVAAAKKIRKNMPSASRSG